MARRGFVPRGASAWLPFQHLLCKCRHAAIPAGLPSLQGLARSVMFAPNRQLYLKLAFCCSGTGLRRRARPRCVRLQRCTLLTLQLREVSGHNSIIGERSSN